MESMKLFTADAGRGKFDFVSVPQILLYHENFKGIDYGAKILYGLMVNRINLSIRSADKFKDENDDLYIVYTIEQIMDDMNCSNKTAVKMLKQLEVNGLIRKRRQGLSKPTLIYVYDVTTVHFLNCTSYTSRDVHSTLQEVKDVHSINKYNKNKDYSNNLSIYQCNSEVKTYTSENDIDRTDRQNSYGKLKEQIKEQVRYDLLEKEYSKEELDGWIETMIDIFTSLSHTIRIAGAERDTRQVQERFSKIDSETLSYAIDEFHKIDKPIKNIPSYMKTCLYQAPVSIDSYWSNFHSINEKMNC